MTSLLRGREVYGRGRKLLGNKTKMRGGKVYGRGREEWEEDTNKKRREGIYAKRNRATGKEDKEEEEGRKGVR